MLDTRDIPYYYKHMANVLGLARPACDLARVGGQGINNSGLQESK
jgi:hypothetical protein